VSLDKLVGVGLASVAVKLWEVEIMVRRYFPSALADSEKKSVIELAYAIVCATRDNPNIKEDHIIRALTKSPIWHYSEADGKHNTRFQSKAASLEPEDLKLKHSHPFSPKWIAEELLKAKSKGEVEEIFARYGMGCLVTREEFELLERYRKKGIDGWTRFRHGKIEVIDGKTGEFFKFPVA
jgi:hypothetical protein